MATLSLTEFSSYRFGNACGILRPDGGVTILLGAARIDLTASEWRNVLEDVGRDRST